MAFIRTLDNKLYKDTNGNKVDTKDWKNAPVELWNTTTLMEYIDHLNKEKYGMAPVRVNLQMLRGVMSRDLKQYGGDVMKRFVEACMTQYKPSPQYPTIGYMTMRSFYFENVLPRVIAGNFKHNAVKKAEEEAIKSFDVDEITDLF